MAVSRSDQYSYLPTMQVGAIVMVTNGLKAEYLAPTPLFDKMLDACASDMLTAMNRPYELSNLAVKFEVDGNVVANYTVSSQAFLYVQQECLASLKNRLGLQGALTFNLSPRAAAPSYANQAWSALTQVADCAHEQLVSMNVPVPPMNTYPYNNSVQEAPSVGFYNTLPYGGYNQSSYFQGMPTGVYEAHASSAQAWSASAQTQEYVYEQLAVPLFPVNFYPHVVAVEEFVNRSSQEDISGECLQDDQAASSKQGLNDEMGGSFHGYSADDQGVFDDSVESSDLLSSVSPDWAYGPRHQFGIWSSSVPASPARDSGNEAATYRTC